MTTTVLQRRCTTWSLFAAVSFLTSTGCSHSTPPPIAAAPPPAPVPSIVGNWAGTQNGLTDVNHQPFQFRAQFMDNGAFTLVGNWQGMSGPAGQSMAGTYTQSGTAVTLTITENQALAAGQTLAMQGYTANGTVAADGKSIDVGRGPAEYLLTRS